MDSREIEQVDWNKSFDTGIEQIDLQHRRIVEMINQLIADAPSAKGEVITQILQAMRRYIAEHFSYEEYLMREAGYKYLRQHTALHQRFIDKVGELVVAHEQGSLNHDTMIQFLLSWLLDHIGHEDQDYVQSVKLLQTK